MSLLYLVKGEDGPRRAREWGAVAVVVDALRASATLATLLQRGALEVHAVGSVEEARAHAAGHPGCLLAGERGGLRPEGFDLGNSPLEVQEKDLRGRLVVMTTTTGTRRILESQGARAVLVGSPVNASALARAVRELLATEPSDVVLIAAGVAGDPEAAAEEDLAAAVYLGLRLHLPVARESQPVWEAHHSPAETQLSRAFQESAHGLHLATLGYAADVVYCARPDVAPCVPASSGAIALAGGGLGVRLLPFERLGTGLSLA